MQKIKVLFETSIDKTKVTFMLNKNYQKTTRKLPSQMKMKLKKKLLRYSS